MAALGEVRFRNRREALEGFARTLGASPPRDPVPSWWDAFDAWYREVRASKDLRDSAEPDVTSVGLRLEHMRHDDEIEDDGYEEHMLTKDD